ncbi:hypothetical protein PVK06_017165 [Gossypium arboreum]|uniref:Uncharacterized protein n=1 Tax=Gossypium arboreum TaxID=29729 RepID=A0ABR0Q205_GOSAR|nr:hypothetical protein PVK06_017165 [Gossypium arboreum]
MDDISPAQSNKESVQLLTSSGGDGDGPGGNNENTCQRELEHMFSDTFYGGQGIARYHYAADLSLYETNAYIHLQHRRGRNDRTHGRMRENFHDSFTGSSSRSLATNENEISESSSQSSHSYQPNAFYPPYFGHNSSYGSFSYHLLHHMFPTNDASHGSIPPHFAYSVMPFSHGTGGD